MALSDWVPPGGFGRPYPGPRDPRGDPDRRIPPTPTLREMQMQAAHRGRGPGDWQAGGAVGLLSGTMAGPYQRSGLPSTFQAPIRANPSMLSAGMARRANQAQRQASRGPGGWQEGGVVDYASNFAAPWHRDADPSESLMAEGTMENPSESLMNERARLQQLLQQTTDEAMAQEILMRIMEITKELEMGAQNFGMANGGIASLMGGGRPVDTRYAAYEARKRNRPPPPPPQIQIGRAPYPMGQNPYESPYDPANQPVVARPIGPGGG